MCGRVEVTAVGGAGVEKPSGAKLEMPVVLGRFSGLERPKKKKGINNVRIAKIQNKRNLHWWT